MFTAIQFKTHKLNQIYIYIYIYIYTHTHIYIYICGSSGEETLQFIKFKLKGLEGSNDVIFSTVQLRNIFHSFLLQKFKMCIKVRERIGK
jgi:hypothetical protein